MSDYFGTDANDNIYAGINNDSLFGGLGSDRLSGGYGNDSLFGDPISTYVPNNDADYLIGGAGSDSILDEWGENRLFGGSGNDVIIGVGNLYGGDGADVLGNSFQGHTTITGGRGADIFDTFLNAIPEQFVPGTTSPQVTIKDFHPSEGDKLSLLTQDNVGNFFGMKGFPGDPGSIQVLNLFDSNHDNKLSATDNYVDLTADGKGIDLNWWGSHLTIEHTTSISADWIV